MWGSIDEDHGTWDPGNFNRKVKKNDVHRECHSLVWLYVHCPWGTLTKFFFYSTETRFVYRTSKFVEVFGVSDSENNSCLSLLWWDDDLAGRLHQLLMGSVMNWRTLIINASTFWNIWAKPANQYKISISHVLSIIFRISNEWHPN